MASSILLSGLLAWFFIAALASDPSPLQDFCIADTNSQEPVTMASADQTSSLPVPDPVGSSDSNELNTNPYCLKSGDNPGSILVTDLLIGRINYSS
ncbi:putative germin-like protein 8-1 [Quercus suber]|uniref:putative germin-like protein 8-1 n=1 Tax=Quercus suber TaxID=58331 RepID=UPI0032E00D20